MGMPTEEYQRICDETRDKFKNLPVYVLENELTIADGARLASYRDTPTTPRNDLEPVVATLHEIIREAKERK